MALRETNLLGETVDKVDKAIARLRAFEPPEGYYLAFSGGKDSTVLKALADEAGVKYDAHYNATTVDPPELVRYIRKHHPDVEIVKPDIPMRKLIPLKLFPPTRFSRYCCEHYKEAHGKGRLVLTGTRWEESSNRKRNQGAVTMRSGRAAKVAEDNGAKFTATAKGGVVLNYDDAPSRRTVEQCYRTHKTLVNPIIDWTKEDVWEYIRTRDLPYCELYDEGWERLGCVGCPMGGYASMEAELTRWPAIRAVYLRAFRDMIAARRERGLPCTWETPEDVMACWLGKQGTRQIDGQTSMFEEDDT